MSNLHAERGPIHVHVGGTMIVEGAAPSYQRLVAHVEKRLLLVPRFRQRIVKIPLGIENPVWETIRSSTRAAMSATGARTKSGRSSTAMATTRRPTRARPRRTLPARRG